MDKSISEGGLAVRLYRYVVRAFPIYSGLTKLGFNAISNVLFSFEDKQLLAHTQDGVPIVVDTSDYHGRILYLFGTNDRKVQHTANSFLQSGDTFLDIGANYGTIGLSAAVTVRKNGTVHLFEPQPVLCSVISQALRAKNIGNVEIHQIALFDEDGEMELARPKNHSGMASLVAELVPDDWIQFKVVTRRTVDYVAPLVKQNRFGVKIDVEGAECRIIPDLLTFENMRFLIFEGGPNKRKLYEILTQDGLAIFGLSKTLFRVRLVRIDQLAEMKDIHDFLALRPSSNCQLPKRTSPRDLAAIFQ